MFYNENETVTTKENSHSSKILPGNETYMNQTTLNPESEEDLNNPLLKHKVADFLLNQVVEIILLLIILIYTGLVFIQITFEEETEDWEYEMHYIELVLLVFFVIEFGLRIYAFREVYTKDPWNIFDMIVVFLSLVFTVLAVIYEDIAESEVTRFSEILKLMRLIILFRRLNFIRKIKETRSTIKKLNQLNVSTSAEKVMEILEMLLNSQIAANNTEFKEEIEWALDVIAQNKLYEVNFEGNNREKAEEWINEQQPPPVLDIRSSSRIIMTEEPLIKFSIPQESLELINSLEFNIFKWKESLISDELVHLMLFLFETHYLFLYTHIEIEKFKNWVFEIQEGYLENPYHNSTHAADVVEYYNFLILGCKAKEICRMTHSDIAICLMSACIHDFQHPGVTNSFLINTRHELAILYNDKSVLENHHVSAAFELFSYENMDVLSHLSFEEFAEYRLKMISIVLATDMTRHFTDISKLKTRFSVNNEIKDENDKLMVFEAMMHASDISNQSRPWKVCQKWTFLLLEEFFNQGDQERILGLPISHLCDRNTVSIPKSQIIFIDVIVDPAFSALELVLPLVESLVICMLQENRLYWDSSLF